MKSDYKLKKGRITLVPGSFDGSSFEPCKKFAPGMVSPLASSNSYIMVNEGVEFITSGDIVKVMPIRFCFTNEKEMNLVSC